MHSLRQILAAHAPLLVLDAASARVQVGWFGGSPTTGRWETAEEEAGVGLFQCLGKLAVDLGEVRGFAFCEGPGSVLGIRTAAVAIRTWCALAPRPAFAYGSLALVAAALAGASPGASVVADARRGHWHRQARGRPLERVTVGELSGPLLMPAGFRHWAPLPPGVGTTPYDLADLLPATADLDLFRATAEPDAFLHQEPNYVTWTPQIHRAP